MKQLGSQAGFTLVELMVALVLGLLIVAAAVQLYITGISSYRMQEAMGDIQDNAGFGVNYVLADIRQANLDTATEAIHDQTPYSGLILTQANVGDKINLNCAACLSADKITTLGEANVVDQLNSQLLVRFRAVKDGYDCSGTTLMQGSYVVQRYFVGSTTTDPRLSLRCEAAQYTQADLDGLQGSNKHNLLWRSSSVILPNVDYFYVRVGYAQGSLESPSSIAYGSLQDYLALNPVQRNIDGLQHSSRPYIHAVQIGLLLNSNQSAGLDQNLKERNARVFQVLNQEVQLKTAAQNTHFRQVVNQTITLRNALGWVEEGCRAGTTGCNIQGAGS